MTFVARLFHAVTYRQPRGRSVDDELAYEFGSLWRFLGRFVPPLSFAGRTVLDIGCGGAVLCVEAARQGAAHVTGVDLDVDLGRVYLERQGAELSSKVTLVETAGDLGELGDQSFDMILSKDSFEHYDDPESFIASITARLNPGGELVIGFGPLWKSPTGGHIGYMTPLPWAHLLFPEDAIMAERRRFRPEENAHRWSEVRGGLNEMTLERFQRILRTSGLEPVYFATNVSDNRVVKAMDILSKVPGLREFFTQNVYTILRKPN
jgi:SAM-dependent methyltransferase